MKKRLSIFLLLLVLLPLLVLVWMGLRLLSNERIVAEHQQQQLATAQLKTAQASIHSFFESLQTDSIGALSFLDATDGVDARDIQLIRRLVESDPYLEQIFILDAQRNAIFPLAGPSASNKERVFLDTSLEMFLDDKVFRSASQNELNGDDRGVSENLSNANEQRGAGLFDLARKASSRSQESLEVLESYGADVQAKVVRDIGWSTWDAGAETQIYFWFRDAQQNLIGQKLSASYWLAQLISQLPDERQSLADLGEASIRLVDKRQRVIYQWGHYPVTESTQAQAQMWLGHPLDGWRLAYFSQTSDNDYASRLLLFSTLMFSLALLMIGVGWLVWRSYQREIRLAEQRVSFVNQVSHELKTPLTNICMYADLIEDEVIGKPEPDQARVKKFSDVLTSESQRLARLINNVLNFSKAQEQKINLDPTVNVVDDLIYQTLRSFDAAFAAKHIEFDLQLNAQQAVMVDPQVVEQVLNNLLSNIEKYAAHGKLARISSSWVDGYTQIIVSDAGPGVARKSRNDIFKPFVRGSTALTEGVSGTGIGLSIAKHLCQLHGGELSLQDNNSVGAHFLVRLKTPKADQGEQ